MGIIAFYSFCRLNKWVDGWSPYDTMYACQTHVRGCIVKEQRYAYAHIGKAFYMIITTLLSSLPPADVLQFHYLYKWGKVLECQ